MELGWGLTHQFIPLVIFIMCIGGILATLFYRIEIGLGIFLFFLPLQNVLQYAAEYPMGNDLNDLLLAAMIIRWFINAKRDGRPLMQKSPMNIPIFLLIGWTFLGVLNCTTYLGLPSILSTDNPVLVSWKNYLYAPLLYFIIVNNVRDPKMIKILVLVMVFSMLSLDRNFYSIIRYRDNSHYTNEMAVMGTGMALSGNWLAVFLAQNTAVVIALFMSDKAKYRRILYGTVMAFSLYCVMFLFSRSGYLAVASSIMVLGLLKNRSLIILALLVVLLYDQILPNAVKERIEMTRTEDGYDATTQERLFMWEQAKSMISESPLVGWGFDVTSQMSIRIATHKERTWNSFHNNYLQTLVELGAIGLLLVLLVFLSGAYSGWLLHQQTEDPFFKGLGVGLVASVFAMLAGNIAGSYWQYYQVGGFFWAFAGLANGARRGLIVPTTSAEETAATLNQTGDYYGLDSVPLP
jgi:O-antigen ligase